MKKLMQLIESGEKTAFVKTAKGEEMTVDYKDTEDLKHMADNSDIKAIKTASGDFKKGNFTEEVGRKYTTEESEAVGRVVAKSLLKVLRAQGDEVVGLKLTGLKPDNFNIHVEYGNDKGSDTFKFNLNPEGTAIILDLGNEPMELVDFVITQGNTVSLPTPELEDKLSDAMKKYVGEPTDAEYDDMAAMEPPTDPSQLNKNMAEGIDTEADRALIHKLMAMYETEPSKFEKLHKQAQAQASTNSDIKYKHLLSLIDRAKAGALQSLANQDRFEADREGMDEKLGPKSKPETYIKDFAKSKAPQFKGKSPEKKRQMAIAAYMSNKNEALDPVGKEDKDINNDGKVDSTDKYLAKRRQAIAKNMKEDLDLGHQDDEPGMLLGDLYGIMQSAKSLYEMISQFEGQGEVDFPHWWQAKIINAKANLSAARQYLDFEVNKPQAQTVVATLGEAKGTCCHKCGHVHVKGTAHPTPYLTGQKNCKFRD